MITPLRGDIWFVRLHPSESPVMAVVVSAEHRDNDPEYYAVLPHEARAEECRFDVPVSNRYMRDGVFNVQRLTAISRSQCVQPLGVLAPSDMDSIEQRLYVWLEL